MRRQSVREALLLHRGGHGQGQGSRGQEADVRRGVGGLPSLPHLRPHSLHRHPPLPCGGPLEGGRGLRRSRHLLLPTVTHTHNTQDPPQLSTQCCVSPSPTLFPTQVLRHRRAVTTRQPPHLPSVLPQVSLQGLSAMDVGRRSQQGADAPSHLPPPFSFPVCPVCPVCRFNDLDNIGFTGRHYSGFIMLGIQVFNKPNDFHLWMDESLHLHTQHAAHTPHPHCS